MKRLVSIACSVALYFVPAFAERNPKGATMTDQQFVDFAAQTDMMEANLGQLAASNATGQGVKDYAQMLVTDHTTDYNQLNSVAAKASLNVPKGLDAQHDRMIAPFEKLHGTAFDRHYLQEMVSGHTKAISIYEKEAQEAQNADLKAYANEALPVLRKHLDSAKDVEKGKSSKM